jgi:4-hydroxythreonine-4-phosphate dehydrogenase
MGGARYKLGLTLGDPTGIGPELWIKTLLSEYPHPEQLAQFVFFADPHVLLRTAETLGKESEWRGLSQHLRVEPVTELRAQDSVPGKPNPQSGKAQVSYLQAAVQAAKRKEIDGLCTGPLHKASALSAGFPFPGHTDFLAAELAAKNRQVVMMLAGKTLRVALCTTHIPLREVSSNLSVSRIVSTLLTTVDALALDFGERSPVVYVLGLNPHAGEHGHLGDEEARLIQPAIHRVLSDPSLHDGRNVRVVGPLVPDVAFRHVLRAHKGQTIPPTFVAMYHDQGLIPLKLLDFDSAVNVTLGLSVVRTSPDHGTAHDIAGQGIAEPASLQAAVRMCLEQVEHRRNFVCTV